MRRLALLALAAALAACAPAAAPPAEEQVAADSAAETAEPILPPPPEGGQGAPAPQYEIHAEPQPMNAPPAGAEPGLDRGVPICPGDPRCKPKK